MLFLRSLIDFPSNLHRLCNGGSLEVYWRILPSISRYFLPYQEYHDKAYLSPFR